MNHVDGLFSFSPQILRQPKTAPNHRDEKPNLNRPPACTTARDTKRSFQGQSSLQWFCGLESEAALCASETEPFKGLQHVVACAQWGSGLGALCPKRER